MPENWVKQIASGDYEAFRSVYETYGKQIYRRALAQTGDREQAKNILKQVFQTLLRQLQKSGEDPLLFLLESLTDLELGKLAQQAQPAAQEPAEESVTEEAITEEVAEAEQEAPLAQTTEQAPSNGEELAAQEPSEKPCLQEEQPAQEPIAEEAVAKKETTEEMTEQTTKDSSFVAMEIDLQDEYEELEAEEAFAQMELNLGLLPEKEAPPPKKKKRFGRFLGIVFVILVILFVVWVGVGILMAESILPSYDLGYSWFDENIFSIFRLGITE